MARLTAAQSGWHSKSSESADVDVRGLSEVIKQLEKFPKEIEKRVVRRELRKASKIILSEAKQRAPRRSGELEKGLKIRMKAKKGSRWLRSQVRSTARHSHLIEFGHRMVGHKPNKKVVGFVPPTPYLRPAMINNQDRVMSTLGEGVAKSIAKLEKKGF